jgi:tetratricopeptide (TPR) repeat protein
MRMVSAALAALLSLGLLSVATAQTSAPTPSPAPGPTLHPPPGLGQPPGPGPGDVLPAPDTSPLPGAPGKGAPANPGGQNGAAAGPTPTLPGQAPAAPVVQFTRAQQLDQLFILLKSAPDGDVATAVEKKISAIWDESGSDTIDLLAKWADDAIDAMNYPLALDYLDRITTLKPDYVEGWDKRANVYFMTEDYGRALADLEHVLALEPRHFGALAGLGTILHALGQDGKAVVAYKAALDLDPNLGSVKDALSQLRDYDTHT